MRFDRAKKIEIVKEHIDGNIILYDYYGRPLHMSNAMNVHSGILYLDIPTKERQTFYGKTGNWFPYLCAAYSLFALISGFFLKKKENASVQQSK